jgi:hypothetical protein
VPERNDAPRKLHRDAIANALATSFADWCDNVANEITENVVDRDELLAPFVEFAAHARERLDDLDASDAAYVGTLALEFEERAERLKHATVSEFRPRR